MSRFTKYIFSFHFNIIYLQGYVVYIEILHSEYNKTTGTFSRCSNAFVTSPRFPNCWPWQSHFRCGV